MRNRAKKTLNDATEAQKLFTASRDSACRQSPIQSHNLSVRKRHETEGLKGEDQRQGDPERTKLNTGYATESVGPSSTDISVDNTIAAEVEELMKAKMERRRKQRDVTSSLKDLDRKRKRRSSGASRDSLLDDPARAKRSDIHGMHRSSDRKPDQKRPKVKETYDDMLAAFGGARNLGSEEYKTCRGKREIPGDSEDEGMQRKKRRRRVNL